jgi:hypothetical protein
MIPLVPDLYEESKPKNKIVNEIDKQFWQTINRVRVAGGGETNYAIAKDDLGNWYVKNYSTDIATVAQSARKLALFAGGGVVPQLPLDTPLTGTQTPEQLEQARQAAAQKDAGYASHLGKTFEKFETAYRGASLDALKSLQASAKGFGTALESVWTEAGVPEAERKVLAAEIAIGAEDPIQKKLIDLDETAIAAIKKGDEAKVLFDAMQAVRSYHAKAASKIKAADATKVTKKNAAIKALTEVVLTNTLKKTLDDAKESVDSFTDAIAVLGQF